MKTFLMSSLSSCVLPQQDDDEPRRKVLCLHGWRTSPDVMKYQITELEKRLTHCTLHFMPGRVEQPEACDTTIGSLFPPPYYAHWNNQMGVNVSNEDISASLRQVSKFIAEHGPFHAVIGFSQGGGLASLLLALQHKQSMQPLPILVCVCAVRPDHRQEQNDSSTITHTLLGPNPLISPSPSGEEDHNERVIVACESIHVLGLKDSMATKSIALSEVPNICMCMRECV